MTGGGFGGCTVSLVRKAYLEALAAAIGDDYRRQTGIAPSLFTTRPAQARRSCGAKPHCSFWRRVS